MCNNTNQGMNKQTKPSKRRYFFSYNDYLYIFSQLYNDENSLNENIVIIHQKWYSCQYDETHSKDKEQLFNFVPPVVCLLIF